MATKELVYEMTPIESSPDIVELALAGKSNALSLFSPNGLDPILGKIRAEVAAHVSDISTERGRKAIASLARKVASSKVRLDDLGKELVFEVKAQVGAIDAERKRMRDELDQLRDDTRRPLTEWEDAEKNRLQGHEDAIAAIESFGGILPEATTFYISNAMAEVNRLFSRNWQEFEGRATRTKESVLFRLQEKLAEIDRREKEAAEFARLQAAEAARLQQEREERIKAQAAAEAKAEAEAKARAEAEAEERRQHEAAAKAKQEAEARIEAIEKLAAEEKAEAEARAKADREYIERQSRVKHEAADKARKEAEERTRQVEAAAAREKVEADAAAKREREEAERAQREAVERTRKAEEAAAKAVRDAEQATERERQRVAEEKRLEDAAIAKREANKRRRASVHRGIVAAFVALGAEDALAIKLVTSMAKNEIPSLSISY